MSVLIESKTYKPFKYPWAVEKAVAHEKVHWGEWEAKLQDDVAQWNNGKLTDVERNHITQILRLFTQSDVQVELTIWNLTSQNLRIMKYVRCLLALLTASLFINALTLYLMIH